MDFDLSDEQRMLQDSATRFVRERCGFEQWQRWRAAGKSAGTELWPVMAQMGWLGLPFAIEDGGFGGGPLDTMLLMEAFGRGLIAEPFLQTAVLAGEVLRRSPVGATRSARIEALIEGHCRVALACDEPASRYDQSLVQTRAEPVVGGWRLHGRKTVVINGAEADALIASACAPDGITLFWLDPKAAGLTIRPYPLVDGGRGADVTLNGVEVDESARIGEVGEGLALLMPAINVALAAIGAEALGIIDLLLAQTVAFTSARRQFGQPVARFQALRHRMVDMFMHAEQTRSLVVLATIRVAEEHADAAKVLSALKVQVGKAGRFVSQQAVQLHGGMGMTDEIVVGHAFKRLLSLDAQLGNVDHHLERFAALSS
jgi:alkylation response protein AidB-like acyl-CoA dehydrogenase